MQHRVAGGCRGLQGIERCRVALGFTQSDAQGSASPHALVWRTIHTVQCTSYRCILFNAIFQCNAASCTTVSTAQAPLCLKHHSAESSVGWCRTQKFSPTLRQWLSLVRSRNEERGSGGYLILGPFPPNEEKT